MPVTGDPYRLSDASSNADVEQAIAEASNFLILSADQLARRVRAGDMIYEASGRALVERVLSAQVLVGHAYAIAGQRNAAHYDYGGKLDRCPIPVPRLLQSLAAMATAQHALAEATTDGAVAGQRLAVTSEGLAAKAEERLVKVEAMIRDLARILAPLTLARVDIPRFNEIAGEERYRNPAKVREEPAEVADFEACSRCGFVDCSCMGELR